MFNETTDIRKTNLCEGMPSLHGYLPMVPLLDKSTYNMEPNQIILQAYQGLGSSLAYYSSAIRPMLYQSYFQSIYFL